MSACIYLRYFQGFNYVLAYLFIILTVTELYLYEWVYEHVWVIHVFLMFLSSLNVLIYYFNLIRVWMSEYECILYVSFGVSQLLFNWYSITQSIVYTCIDILSYLYMANSWNKVLLLLLLLLYIYIYIYIFKLNTST